MATKINGALAWEAAKNNPIIIMAANTRHALVVPGIMKAAEEMNSAVAFELSKREIYKTNIPGLYPEGDHSLSGLTPESYAHIINKYAEDFPNLVYFLHGDHIQIKEVSLEQIGEAKELIDLEIKAGFTSFGLDPSFLPLKENVAVLTALVIPIMKGRLGLECELGEINKDKDITSVEEAVEYIESLKKASISPHLLALNNGSKHGNYSADEKVHIALDRTKEIYEKVKIPIAQHGITGTPLDLTGQFADYGIRKGNVGTEWQNVLFENIPQEIVGKAKKWAENKSAELNRKIGVEYALCEIKEEVDSLSSKIKEKVIEAAYQRAKAFFKAFRCENSASLINL